MPDSTARKIILNTGDTQPLVLECGKPDPSEPANTISEMVAVTDGSRVEVWYCYTDRYRTERRLTHVGPFTVIR